LTFLKKKKRKEKKAIEDENYFAICCTSKSQVRVISLGITGTKRGDEIITNRNIEDDNHSDEEPSA